jgi:hypothetical protein
MKLKEVNYLRDYTLHVVFEDGVEGDLNLSHLVEEGIFTVLKDTRLFSKAYTSGRSIAWSDELEIDADAVYLDLTGKSIEDIMPLKNSYASD